MLGVAVHKEMVVGVHWLQSEIKPTRKERRIYLGQYFRAPHRRDGDVYLLLSCDEASQRANWHVVSIASMQAGMRH